MQNNNVKSSQIASSANRNRDGTYFNYHLGLNASFIRYAEVEVWRRMRRWTHSVFFLILINGRNSFFNWSLHWRCRPDCLRSLLFCIGRPRNIQILKCTCWAIVVPIRSFVFSSPRCRRRRGLRSQLSTWNYQICVVWDWKPDCKSFKFPFET